MTMGNFSIALSGLQAESVALNTIGNNLANLNTTAFKRQPNYPGWTAGDGISRGELAQRRCEPEHHPDTNHHTFGKGSRTPFYLRLLLDGQPRLESGGRHDVLVSSADIRHAWPKSPVNCELHQNCNKYMELHGHSAAGGCNWSPDK